MRIESLNDLAERDLDSWTLNWACWGFAFSHLELQRIQKHDSRLWNVFFALKNEEILGQVGLLKCEINTLYGPEQIAGIWGVCTNPNYANKGISKKILKHTHSFIKENNIKFSYLTVSVNNIAYRLYQQFA